MIVETKTSELQPGVRKASEAYVFNVYTDPFLLLNLSHVRRKLWISLDRLFLPEESEEKGY